MVARRSSSKPGRHARCSFQICFAGKIIENRSGHSTLSLAQSHPKLLLTTRTRAAIGAVATAYVLVLKIRRLLLPAHAESGWLITSDGLLPSWLPIILHVVFYAAFCFIAFSWTRGTWGRERLFIVAWSVAILLSPLKTLGPHWALIINSICAFGLAVALFVAVSLVLQRSSLIDPSGIPPAPPAR